MLLSAYVVRTEEGAGGQIDLQQSCSVYDQNHKCGKSRNLCQFQFVEAKEMKS